STTAYLHGRFPQCPAHPSRRSLDRIAQSPRRRVPGCRRMLRQEVCPEGLSAHLSWFASIPPRCYVNGVSVRYTPNCIRLQPDRNSGNRSTIVLREQSQLGMIVPAQFLRAEMGPATGIIPLKLDWKPAECLHCKLPDNRTTVH